MKSKNKSLDYDAKDRLTGNVVKVDTIMNIYCDPFFQHAIMGYMKVPK